MHCARCHFDLKGLPSRTCPECGQAFNPDDRTSFLVAPPSPAYRIAKRFAILSVLVFLIAAVVGVYLFVRGVRTAFLAEERLQVSHMVCELVAEHVERSPTHAWPTSWTDLEKLPPRENVYRWPEDSAKVQAMVSINFNTSTQAVLQKSPTTFVDIKLAPGPDYSGVPQRWFYELFDRLNEAVGAPAGTLSPQPSGKESAR